MKKERLFWGILFILAGIFLIISKLGFFPEVNAFSLLLSVFLGAIVIKSVIRLNFAGILFPLAFICIIYDDVLGITAISPWTLLLAALLGSIGLSMIFNKNISYFNVKWDKKCEEFEKIDIEDESHIRLGTSFGSSVKYINTDKFIRADFKCDFGSMNVYFDNAIMDSESAMVNLDVSFGGMEIYVPRAWKIEDRTNVSFGNIEYKNNNNNNIETTNTLILVGSISFSGVEIIYI